MLHSKKKGDILKQEQEVSNHITNRLSSIDHRSQRTHYLLIRNVEEKLSYLDFFSSTEEGIEMNHIYVKTDFKSDLERSFRRKLNRRKSEEKKNEADQPYL